ncbi:MAG: TRC40/GET3/ArsA family transport-energizing ATPase [Thermoplasmata archaeon]
MRIIFYTGKGGVGKTTISASTAILSAESGKKTLIMSTDSAHSTSDSLEKVIYPYPTEIYPNLWAQEIDVNYEIETHWKEVANYLSLLFSSFGLSDLKAKEMAIFPGMDLIAALFNIERYTRNNNYDVIVVDTAPTADTMRLLSFPNVVEWYFTRLFKLNKYFIKVGRATVGKFVKTPLPEDEVINSMEQVYVYFKSIQNILADVNTTVRLVVNPEKMVINETQRAFTYLSLYNMTVEGLIINKIMKENKGSEYFTDTVKEHTENLRVIDNSFPTIKKFFAPVYNKEIIGINSLKKIGKDIFGDSDPTDIYTREKPIKFIEEKSRVTISMLIPFLDSNAKIEAFMDKDMLYVTVGTYKGSIALPISLYNASIVEAKYKNDHLNIVFGFGNDEGND